MQQNNSCQISQIARYVNMHGPKKYAKDLIFYKEITCNMLSRYIAKDLEMIYMNRYIFLFTSCS